MSSKDKIVQQVEIEGEAYTLDDVRDYLNRHSSNPFLEAALILLDKQAVAIDRVTESRDYGRDIINDMKLEAQQYEVRIEKLTKEVFRLTDETLHVQFKQGSPAALSQEGVFPEPLPRRPHAWLPYTEDSLLVPRDKYWIYNTAACIVQHAQYCGPGTDKEALWKTHAGIIFNKYVSHYAPGIYEPAPPAQNSSH